MKFNISTQPYQMKKRKNLLASVSRFFNQSMLMMQRGGSRARESKERQHMDVRPREHHQHALVKKTRNITHTVFSLLLLTPSLSCAFFCPNNFKQIEMGNTIEQVTAACGKPDKEVTRDLEPTVPQEWSYYVPQTVAADTMVAQSGTLKTTVTFDKDGKAINISVNGVGVGSSTVCGAPIQLGSTIDQVKSACGKPSFINKQQPDAPGATPNMPKSKITEFTYGTATLTFTNGILTGR